MPLLKLLDSKNGSLQHNAAFALYGLADNEVEFVGPLFNFNLHGQFVLYQSSNAGNLL